MGRRPGDDRVVHRVVEADLDRLDGLGDVVEADQVHLREVVDRDVQEGLDGLEGGGPPGLPALPLQLRFGQALTAQLLLGGLLGDAVRLLDLVHLPVRADGLHIVVARDGQGRHLAPVGRYVQDDQRVGVVPADLAGAGVQFLLDELLGQVVAVHVLAAVEADEQQVDGLVEVRGRVLPGLGERARLDHAAVELPVLVPDQAARAEDGHREGAGEHASGDGQRSGAGFSHDGASGRWSGRR